MKNKQTNKPAIDAKLTASEKTLQRQPVCVHHFPQKSVQ